MTAERAAAERIYNNFIAARDITPEREASVIVEIEAMVRDAIQEAPRCPDSAPECHPACGSPYFGNSHHPDCERGAWESAHTCQKCNRAIEGEIYLCMECTHPFHRVCLFEHCGKDQMTNESYLDALKNRQ